MLDTLHIFSWGIPVLMGVLLGIVSLSCSDDKEGNRRAKIFMGIIYFLDVCWYVPLVMLFKREGVFETSLEIYALALMAWIVGNIAMAVIGAFSIAGK